ncbi:MAG TPA: mobile mystery protein B [bacterium]|nr:mobile mystery protein B [bacterium]
MGKNLNPPKVPGATPPDDFSGLKTKYVKTQAQLNLAEFENINRVLPKYFLAPLTGNKAKFNYEWFLKLHREMFDDVWEWAGEIRKTGLTIGIEPKKIGAELHRLTAELHQWEKERVDLFEIAVRLHHRLVWIHPFYGGNGRWARFAANIYLRKKNQRLVFWPEDQMTVESGLRVEYIEALREADHDDFTHLIRLHKQYQEEKL